MGTTRGAADERTLHSLPVPRRLRPVQRRARWPYPVTQRNPVTGAAIMIKNCVLVGLDDSAASRAAHRWGAAYAHATGKDLRAVHVLDWPIGLNASAVNPATRLCVPKQDIAEPYWRGVHRVFDETSSPRSVLQFAQGDVGDVLVRLSGHADLLVVGAREPVRGGRYIAGSVSHYCI